ncbi:uncharacterized protein MELLADRAFT_67736 [Melampsora larici-populina 98AG31]|uniref:Uncharacterized protein n=1 Tax=Melampsora larici-populina (strain 98AG31 / pathotype 3-4-7) TaxID=747676 RepID=F4S435_MELLP|nr:uncharacterized protein MELLADRAFT_67736 [Melampsora larici-populina 98AG31]EGG00576.1 hypothetical protein MELLADRAFT_67736 [Melampsora larici-populina 98AG31]
MTFDDLYQKELNRNQARAQTEELESTPSEFIHNSQSLTSGLDDLIVKSKNLLDDGISALNGNFILTDEEEEEEGTEETEEAHEDDESKSQEHGIAKPKEHVISESGTQMSSTSSSSSTKPISIKNKTSSSSILKLLKRRISNPTKRNSSHSIPKHESYASSSLRSVLIEPMISNYPIYPHHPTRFQSVQTTKTNLESIQRNHQTLLRYKSDSDSNTIQNKTKNFSQFLKSTSVSLFQNLISFSHHFSKANMSSRYHYDSIPHRPVDPQNSRQSTKPISSSYVSFPPYSSYFKSKWFSAT